MSRLALGLALVFTCGPAAALAAPPGEPPPGAPPGDDTADAPGGHGHHARGRSACKADADRLCAGEKGKKKTECLVAHLAELSADCKEDVERKQLKSKLKGDCQADVAKYCSEVPTGKDNIESCLVGRKADLAPACKAVVEKVVADFKARPHKGGGKRGHKGE